MRDTTAASAFPSAIDPARLHALHEDERARFRVAHPACTALAARCQAHFPFGVPLHWMRDWPSPASVFLRRAQGSHLHCADDHAHVDFCLGDTGAMFGHAPPAVVQALATQAAQGLTAMLPHERSAEVGALLAQRFGLPYWQLAMTASDANRFVLRWARAMTGRAQVLVFDGCYHGAVDDTLVDRDPTHGTTLRRPSVLGAVHDHPAYTRVVPFNDLDTLEAALRDGQVAALLAEPALTNFGLVPPAPDFWPTAQALCQRYGTLLVLDETHTLSSGVGGWARTHGVQPDLWVAGKAIAGGVPCAVYGMTAEVAARLQAVKAQAPEGHSGIGTTLSANALALAALHAALLHLHTPQTYAAMQRAADTLQTGLEERLRTRGLPWTLTRLGARMELQFMPRTPRNADDVRAHAQPALEAYLHLFMLNRGVLLTPFHGMMLCAPTTTPDDIAHFLHAFDAWLAALLD
ncbi:transaminase [Tepidimonas charontis]|uniref:Glutamate-1-semialdehyde 2,1-aminomutase n=1 Tax=Tepidimonas charontis TaxID=2267262 RepID=A0A554XEN6_9BURK|nr:transaminase [Tepidimonas charontis]TSE34293.1 Glutamate-1-semialdehyde 2,1-aminomutase [Tepidimonas charontis]